MWCVELKLEHVRSNINGNGTHVKVVTDLRAARGRLPCRGRVNKSGLKNIKQWLDWLPR